MTFLSICIVNWNTRDYLRECLASIEAFPPACPVEVIVVDNASSDGSAQMVKTEFPSVRLIESSSNSGYAEGNNAAIANASGDWLLLLNPDLRMLPSTLDDALRVAGRLPDFGALGIKQVGPDGAVQRSLRTFPEPIGIFFELSGLSRVFPASRMLSSYRMRWFDYTGTVEVDQPMATFLLSTRVVFEKVGALDPNFPIFFNDVDWCYRTKESGYKVYYTDEAGVVHYGGAATGKAKRSAMAAESKSSFLRFYKKHYRDKLPSAVYNTVCFAVKASLAVQRLRDTIKIWTK